MLYLAGAIFARVSGHVRDFVSLILSLAYGCFNSLVGRRFGSVLAQPWGALSCTVIWGMGSILHPSGCLLFMYLWSLARLGVIRRSKNIEARKHADIDEIFLERFTSVLN